MGLVSKLSFLHRPVRAHQFDRRDIPIRAQGETQQGVSIGDGAWLGAHAVAVLILTSLDVSSPGNAAAVDHWYRYRTTIGSIFRDSKHGAAHRHLQRIRPGRYRLDVGCAGRQHRRLAEPAHRRHPRPDHPGRSRRPRRQGHDRDIAGAVTGATPGPLPARTQQTPRAKINSRSEDHSAH